MRIHIAHAHGATYRFIIKKDLHEGHELVESCIPPQNWRYTRHLRTHGFPNQLIGSKCLLILRVGRRSGQASKHRQHLRQQRVGVQIRAEGRDLEGRFLPHLRLRVLSKQPHEVVHLPSVRAVRGCQHAPVVRLCMHVRALLCMCMSA